ncbi:kinase-like domain-containing protein [Fusarium flagelliforme]|uniref:ethanolamine kinase n=1 Tax=Fusarium flagelliforme TaxID=2675880 RepID=A0A395MI85_9HYPO|nr:kinase-like domain-containing protein [Fusarium flagelliforme]KAH7197660.1 kinase-like domain-containing protein [Fusarium flagelliforme]RFN47617.1 ethanolamine kinase [Fusarium flagelliforme]
MTSSPTKLDFGHVPFLDLTYDNNESHDSALKLILTLMPDWASEDSNVDFVRFTDGITNTLLKAVNRRPGMSKLDVDRDAILLRAYGHGTAVLIDREREAENHELLMRHGLATQLLARFKNGMMYRYILGKPARAQDLSEPLILSAIARRLAHWHATVPCLPDPNHARDEKHVNGNGSTNGQINGHANGCVNGDSDKSRQEQIDSTAPGKPPPNVWTTMQKWIFALPTDTDAQRERQALLQAELKVMVQKLSQRPGLGKNGLVFAHCDLLCANVIIHQEDDTAPTVDFIDYEYATPSPAAFDVANHFAEWAGYDCDYAAVPRQDQRLAFVKEYIKAYFALTGEAVDEEEEVRKLMAEVDAYRGVPGFYWGIWSSIQAVISKIDFDYAQYAELRLGEYWAYKAEEDGSRKATGQEMPLREKTWWRNE